MGDYLELRKFNELDLNDPFFDSLKYDYKEFEEWFKRKSSNEAYVFYENGFINGFLYLKIEEGPITDVEPNILGKKILKIGTFKINPHGTKLGERFIKKALDFAIVNKVERCYLTIFERHTALIELLCKYGFFQYGVKNSHNGQELVLVKDLKKIQNDILLDYPLILARNVNKYLLAIYPEYHSKMFPDSILNNESFDILTDVSHTNSIHKIYVCKMPVYQLNRGDIIVIYRTGDGIGPAEYRAVVTSICIVEEVKKKSDFRDFEEFYNYANSYSIFDRQDLMDWYSQKVCYTIKMTYNAALTKRIIRKRLADEIGLDRGKRWSFIEITDQQFKKIAEMGEVNEGIIIY